MTEADKQFIKTSFRDAKNQKRQVAILAQLFNCRERTILNILGKSEFEHKRDSRRSQEEKEKALDLLESGMSCAEVSKKLNIPRATVHRWNGAGY